MNGATGTLPTGLIDGMIASQTKAYTATIPGSAVTDTVTYYLEGSDGHVKTYAPGTTYMSAYVPLDGQQVGAFPVTIYTPPA